MVSVNVSRIIFALVAFEVVALFLLVHRMKQSTIGDERLVSYLSSYQMPVRRICSTVSSAVGTEDSEHRLYADEGLDVEAIENSRDCMKTFLRKYSDYCEKALVPGPQYQNSYLSSSNNRRLTSICPCISPYLRKYTDVLYSWK